MYGWVSSLFTWNYHNTINLLCVNICSVASVMSDSVALWTITHKTLLSTGLSRQEYWSELPCSSRRDLPNPGIELVSLNVSCIGKQIFFTTSTPWEARLLAQSPLIQTGIPRPSFDPIFFWSRNLQRNLIVLGNQSDFTVWHPLSITIWPKTTL